jgi:argonaute-like protein implicated in RNA metabolism and viral defense
MTLIFPVAGNGAELDVREAFETLDGASLDRKVYLFRNEQKHASQFMGLKQFGPYVPVTSEVRYVFIFEGRFRDFANDLYLGLLGKKFGGIFPGIGDLFSLNFRKSDVSHIPVGNYSRGSLDQTFERVREIRRADAGRPVVGIFITPQEEIELDENTTAYYYLKHLFAGEGLPLQVVNYGHMSNYNTLKWSLANIALQIFCKTGGIPWKVRPSNQRCLIFGIGSAHRADEDGKIQKYFGYSVCLDSSGVFQKVHVLAYHENRAVYLDAFRAELSKMILRDVSGDYDQFALHIPFKIQKSEIRAIRESVRSVSSQTAADFRVLKINTDSKFFGFSGHNTRIPYESSFVRLSYDEYLCWFEGLQYGKKNVYKKVGNPVHIEFMREEGEDDSQDRSYLQDVINLSGANWRGFNSKLVPISIYYASLIARYAKEFEEIDDLEEVKKEISSIKSPWFL